jgi:hypothetical protein
VSQGIVNNESPRSRLGDGHFSVKKVDETRKKTRKRVNYLVLLRVRSWFTVFLSSFLRQAKRIGSTNPANLKTAKNARSRQYRANVAGRSYQARKNANIAGKTQI